MEAQAIVPSMQPPWVPKALLQILIMTLLMTCLGNLLTGRYCVVFRKSHQDRIWQALRQCAPVGLEQDVLLLTQSSLRPCGPQESISGGCQILLDQIEKNAQREIGWFGTHSKSFICVYTCKYLGIQKIHKHLCCSMCRLSRGCSKEKRHFSS